MRTKKLRMFLLTATMIIGTTGVNVFAEEKIDLTSDIAIEENLEDTSEESVEDTSEERVEDTSEESVEESKEDNAGTDEEVMEEEAVAVAAMVEEKASYTKTDLRVMTAIIYCEAGYESYDAKLAVGNVIMNRVSSDLFDHVTTVKEVVYDVKRWGRQFSPAFVRNASGKWTTKGSLMENALKLYKSKEYTSKLQKSMMEESEKAAIAALEGTNEIGDYLYFNSNVSTTKAKCKKNNTPYTIIDNMIFY